MTYIVGPCFERLVCGSVCVQAIVDDGGFQAIFRISGLLRNRLDVSRLSHIRLRHLKHDSGFSTFQRFRDS